MASLKLTAWDRRVPGASRRRWEDDRGRGWLAAQVRSTFCGESYEWSVYPTDEDGEALPIAEGRGCDTREQVEALADAVLALHPRTRDGFNERARQLLTTFVDELDEDECEERRTLLGSSISLPDFGLDYPTSRTLLGYVRQRLVFHPLQEDTSRPLVVPEGAEPEGEVAPGEVVLACVACWRDGAPTGKFEGRIKRR